VSALAVAAALAATGHPAPVLRPALASWYGPGLFGNPLGCGGTLQRWTRGVAHKTLDCGTRVRLCARRCRTTRVIDRGPYVGAREFDLTQALAGAVGFKGLGVIRVRIGG
jgi:rare lipoprotein A